MSPRKLLPKLFLGVLLFLQIHFVQALTIHTDWYIKDFQSDITVNKDSTLLITEKITADASNLPNKHGIFRILPTFYQKTESERIPLLIELISITDFNGKNQPYETLSDDGTITWKIGDANRTVTGENYYLITYRVKNVLRFSDARFDEFYWNLLGTFWQIEIEKFTANIRFPAEITEANTQIDYYTGYFGSKLKNQATYSWIDAHTLQFVSTQTLLPQQGITASVTFPKGIATPYQFSLWELYGAYIWFLIPIILFIWLFKTWYTHGRDPQMNKTVIAEYEAPEKLTPLQIASLFGNGTIQNSAISASIVDLAVRKFLKIEQTQEAGFLKSADFKLTKIGSEEEIAKLSEAEQMVLSGVFSGANEVMLSSLKNKFYKHINKITINARESLVKKGYFIEKGFTMQGWFMAAGAIVFFLSFFLIAFIPMLMAAMLISGIMLFVFGILMPKKTALGSEVLWKTKGFKHFIETAEKYRQAFNEREHIFEEVLPYAMVFGVVGLWVKNMQKIYGEAYFNTYHPYWYTGAMMGNFNADTFTSSLNNLSSRMSSTLASSPSSSGSGGGGSSGGGGGGGGGGGW